MISKPTTAEKSQNIKGIFSAAGSSPRRIAVVLNGKARAVTEHLVRNLGGILGNEDVFISRSLDHSQFIARRVVAKRYDVVLCGGGDGTFSQCVTDILALKPARIPVFGVLRLGTGNALANTLGASELTPLGLAMDLELARTLRQPEVLPLLQVEGKLTPFAGVGIDALILNDYNHIKGTVRGTPLESFTEGPLGYALAVSTRSLWRYSEKTRPFVTILNEGVPTRRMTPGGQAVGPLVSEGGILYQGPVTIAAASTVPYYGLGLKLFPQALLRRDRFQLRIGDISPATVLCHLPALFRGQLRHERLFDFFCTKISIEVEQPTPVQIGGDEVGQRQQLRIGLKQIQVISRSQASQAASTRPQTSTLAG